MEEKVKKKSKENDRTIKTKANKADHTALHFLQAQHHHTAKLL